MTKYHTKKQRFFQTTQATTRLYTRLAWGAPLLSRRVLRVFVVHTSESNRKTWNETADIWQVQYENETTKQLTGNSRII